MCIIENTVPTLYKRLKTSSTCFTSKTFQRESKVICIGDTIIKDAWECSIRFRGCLNIKREVKIEIDPNPKWTFGEGKRPIEKIEWFTGSWNYIVNTWALTIRES